MRSEQDPVGANPKASLPISMADGFLWRFCCTIWTSDLIFKIFYCAPRLILQPFKYCKRIMIEAIIAELLSRAERPSQCTKDTCTIKQSVYGYYPNKPVNIILIVLFGICMIAHIYQALKSRSWTFLVALGVGCFGEATGEWESCWMV